MSNQLLASKVVIGEEPPKLRAVPILPTSVALFVGVTEKGPVGEATQVASFAEYVKIFGGYTANGDVTPAVNGFFLNGGTNAWIVRIVHYTDVTTPGWAVVERINGRERLLDHGVLVLDGKQLPAWNPVAALALRCRKEGLVPDVVAIELPYLGKNVVTLRTLARLFGRFEQAFEPTGVEIVEIMPTKWQHEVLGPLGALNKRRRSSSD
jgi:Holliday junction resolvasome RuvABC endonuclease subunit